MYVVRSHDGMQEVKSGWSDRQRRAPATPADKTGPFMANANLMHRENLTYHHRCLLLFFGISNQPRNVVCHWYKAAVPSRHVCWVPPCPTTRHLHRFLFAFMHSKWSWCGYPCQRSCGAVRRSISWA